MTISELIYELEEAKKYLGDCSIGFYYDNEQENNKAHLFNRVVIDEFSLIKAPNTILGPVELTHKCNITLKKK